MLTISALLIGVTALSVDMSTAMQDRAAGSVREGATAQRASVLAMSPWSPTTKDEFVCTVRETRRPEALSTRTLSIVRRGADREEVLFQFDTPDALVGMLPLGEIENRFLTVWMGATGYHIRVFAYLDGKVQRVLEVASRAFPEFTLDQSSRETILTTDLTLEKGEWTPIGGVTYVYKWTGRAYEVLGRVPWARRLECQTRRSCAALEQSIGK